MIGYCPGMVDRPATPLAEGGAARIDPTAIGADIVLRA